MFVWVIKMLQYDRIDAWGGVYINKTSASKERMFCHYWYCKDFSYKFCHGLWMMVYELKQL